MTMLARLAENLFWAGRYVERAEDTARMVDVTYHSLLESPYVDEQEAWGALLDVLHLRAAYGDGPLEDSGPLLRFLVLDRGRGSITASIERARENTRSVRELVSSELWEAINDLYLMLGSSELRRQLMEQPYELLARVRRSCITIYGVASETMPRDEGWRFMALGRLLERAEMTCRLIEVRYGQLQAMADSMPPARADGEEAERPRSADRPDFHQWTAVLKSASAFEAYRRRYRSSMDPQDVVEFLLLERDLPRSVLYCLTGATHQLEALTGARPSRSTRLLGRATSSLQYRDVAELFDLGLHEFLEHIQEQVGLVAEAVADQFFRQHPAGDLHAIATA